MAKVSGASKDFYEVKGGVQEGIYRITDAATTIFQYPPNRETGDQYPPFLAAHLSFEALNEKLEPLGEDDPLEKILRIEKDLKKLRAGMASSREDPDPEDLGDELGTVGNCVFTESGARINNKSAWAVFSKSLEEAGFKSDIIAEGYFPDLIGMVLHVKTIKGEKANIQGREVEPNYLVCDKILVFPYEKTAAKKPAAKAAPKPAAARPAGAPAQG